MNRWGNARVLPAQEPIVRPDADSARDRAEGSQRGPALRLAVRQRCDEPVLPWGGLTLDVQARRHFALALRLAGRTQSTSARLLGVSQPTVSRDLAYWRRDPPACETQPEAAVAIGEAVALYEEVRTLALGEHARLSVDPAAAGARGTSARLERLRVAMAAQRLQLRVLKAAGLLVVGAAQQPPEEMTANAIAARLKAAGVLDGSA